MFAWLSDSNVLIGGVLLSLAQVLAALPWLWAIDPKGFSRSVRDASSLLTALGSFAVISLFMAAFLGYKGDSTNMVFYGRVYGSILHLQLLIDLFIFGPMLLTLLWPKGGAVALAAYREGWRQPMFWLIIVFGIVATWIFVVLPYFTFGDDYKMMKQIGFDIIILAAMLFGVLAACISISEEIEGRTAITVMSKPINRRHFLIGKYLGILMACGGMSLILAWNFNWSLLVMPEFDPITKDEFSDPMADQGVALVKPMMEKMVFVGGPAKLIASGSGLWFGETLAHSLGVLLGFGKVMILVAVATALATRLSFVINLVICLFVYLLGHLAPVVVKVTDKAEDTGAAAVGLIRFFGNLFDTILPALEFFNMGPAIIRETPLELGAFSVYVATIVGYALIYTAIALIVGLLLFEDRDLA